MTHKDLHILPIRNQEEENRRTVMNQEKDRKLEMEPPVADKFLRILIYCLSV